MTGSTSRVMNARTLLSSSRSCSSSSSSKPRKSEKGESSSPRSSRSLMGVLSCSLAGSARSGTLDDGASSSASVRIAQVPAVVDVQPGRRDQPGLHPRVDDRDDRVVVAAHHQRRLPDQAAGTAGCSSRSSRRAGSSSRASARPGWRACSRCGAALGVGAHAAAVDLGGDAGGVLRVAVASRGRHLREHPRVRRAPSASRCRWRPAPRGVPAGGTGRRAAGPARRPRTGRARRTRGGRAGPSAPRPTRTAPAIG